MGQSNLILAGDNNSINASEWCTIINGQNNTISESKNIHIIGDNVNHDSSLGNDRFYVGCSNGIFCDGDVVASYLSDERYKENITPISGCLDKVLSLDAISFDWNELQNTYSGRDVGLIAQQVQEIAPEIVKKRKDGFLGVKYEKIIPLIVGAIKEQEDELESLEAQLDEIIKSR